MSLRCDIPAFTCGSNNINGGQIADKTSVLEWEWLMRDGRFFAYAAAGFLSRVHEVWYEVWREVSAWDKRFPWNWLERR